VLLQQRHRPLTTVDPVLDIDRALQDPQYWNRYTYVGNRPFRYVDPDCRAAETLWDAFNIGVGVSSFVQNIRSGEYLAAAVDAVGVVADSAAAAVPFVPGGLGTLIKSIRASDILVDAGKKVESIYEFGDAAQKGKTYVGQSGDVAGRLGQHAQSGRLADGTDVTVTPVAGGKTAREVAEQRRINELGGTARKPGSQTSNERNPIGPKRLKRIEDEYGLPIPE
jgi:hypothetical protein